MKITFDIKDVSIVRANQDEICLTLMNPVHGEYEPFNTSALYVKTAHGEGPATLRRLGWTGDYQLIEVGTK